MGKRRVRTRSYKQVIRRGYTLVHLARCPLDKNPKLSMIRCYCFDYGGDNAQV